MPPKRAVGPDALKARPSRSRISKSSSSTPKVTPRSTPRKTKSRSTIGSTRDTPSRLSTTSRTNATTSSRSAPMKTRQKKKVSTSGTSISAVQNTREPSHSPSPLPPGHTTSDVNPEESTGFYGLGIVRSVTQQAREFFASWGYGFGGSETKKTNKRKPGRKRGPRKK
ncbi:hypothetical protein TWF718_010136 [Orbilia javanica]|uniref:Uncharacterized protein n=1 Tax=Orbilia javanica TaxID=47235 RepID=A0AAN8NP36_9PEZI